jgi:hypothetical protein
MACERLDGPAQDRFTEQRGVLFGHGAASPFALAGSDHKYGDARHSNLP